MVRKVTRKTGGVTPVPLKTQLTLDKTFKSMIVVVTGAKKGIGLEICRQLAYNGITVILTTRDEKPGLKPIENLKACGLSDTIFHQLDVTYQTSIASLAVFIKTKIKKLDIMHYNLVLEHTGFEYFGYVGSDLVSRMLIRSMGFWESYWKGTLSLPFLTETLTTPRDGHYPEMKFLCTYVIMMLRRGSDNFPPSIQEKLRKQFMELRQEAMAHVETVIDSVGQDEEEESIPTSSTVWRGSRPSKAGVVDASGYSHFIRLVLWRV
ncbi:hypothetical protein TEA_021789 [Camellia sinensis var. sinensis]|uniref:Uncharacterized protein n=1 Tax=Camellia sinensis var. sinensis TaxID=542762 RepID=A0A4S4EJI2_CAMSN|nr:hypothetical protein TEA_021789 [Camellia sinensis var. sinensis]